MMIMAKWQRVNIEIPKGYSPNERRAIARDIVDFMIDRSKSGKDKDNIAFPPYEKEYKESRDFKTAGKSSRVNLTLSGEMLDSIKLLNHSTTKLLIGHDKEDLDLNGKSEGNREGTYGGKATGKARDYLGITDKDLNKILNRYPKDGPNKNDERVKRAAKVIENTRPEDLFSLNELNKKRRKENGES